MSNTRRIYTNVKTNKLGLISSKLITDGLKLPQQTMSSSQAITAQVSTLYIENTHIAGTNVTITNPYSLYINSGFNYLGSRLDIHMGRITGTSSYSSGEGMEMFYTSSTGNIRGYDSSTLSYTELLLHNTINITGSGGANGAGYVGINNTAPTCALDIKYISTSNRGILYSNTCLRVSGNSNEPTTGVGVELYFDNLTNMGYISAYDRDQKTFKNLKINDSLTISPNDTIKLTTNSTELSRFIVGTITVPSSSVRGVSVSATIAPQLTNTEVITSVQASVHTPISATMFGVNWISNTTTTINFYLFRIDSNRGWSGTIYIHYIAFITPTSSQIL